MYDLLFSKHFNGLRFVLIFPLSVSQRIPVSNNENDREDKSIELDSSASRVNLTIHFEFSIKTLFLSSFLPGSSRTKLK